MSKKYQFQSLYNRPRNQALPIDTNESIERQLKTVFKCAELDELLVHVRERRLWGDILVFDQRLLCVCEMTVSKGIIPKMKLSRIEKFPLTPPYIVMWKPTVLNDKVEMKKSDESAIVNKETEE